MFLFSQLLLRISHYQSKVIIAVTAKNFVLPIKSYFHNCRSEFLITYQKLFSQLLRISYNLSKVIFAITAKNFLLPIIFFFNYILPRISYSL